jgi:cytochrome c oxidase subunit II
MSGRWRCVLIASACGPLSGCAGVQSALAPAGPGADRIALLTFVLLGLCAVVLLLVVLAAWLSIQGSDRVRGWLADTRFVIAGGVALPTIVLSALLAYGLWIMQAAAVMPGASGAMQVEVVGEQWWWRVTYRGRDGSRIESANEIRIPVGAEVDLTLGAADVIHSFWVPSLAGKVDMIPGRTTRLRLSASKPGVYRGQCAEYCGGPHALMALEVVAVPAAEFDRWLAVQGGPAPAPGTDAARHGQRLFLAAGCGACHSVRGTEAAGRIGPDLTRVGARRMLGAGTLLQTKENVQRFILDGQHVKPGNLMPAFRIFSDAEADALATYLVSLQ